MLQRTMLTPFPAPFYRPPRMSAEAPCKGAEYAQVCSLMHSSAGKT
jgi:hypothetical protein